MEGFVPLQRDCLALPPGDNPEPMMLYYGDLVRPTGNRPDFKPSGSKGDPGLEVFLKTDDGEEGPYILLDTQSSRPPLLSKW
ncbi:hypothetical protein KKI23_01240 [Patescibacteria group bacterium]|nr:hypothetical protein [Patescibacteria group bacterium]